MSHHGGGGAALMLLLLSLLALVAVSSATTCYNDLPQPDLQCASRACAVTSNTRAYPLPAGETYASFYSWILGVLGTDGVNVNAAYVNYEKTDPNVYFAPNQANCYVDVSFVYEVASFRNRMGSFKFNREAPPRAASRVVSPTTLFAETTVDCTSSDGGSCLAPGSTVTLGPFTSSDGVGFYLDQDQVCAQNTSARLYSIDALNVITAQWQLIPRQQQGRLVAALRDPNTKRVYFGWEDQPLGEDVDYNDVVFSVTSNCELDYGKIPCAGVTTCRNPRQLFIQASCECTCANQFSCSAPLVYDTDECACACPATTCDVGCSLDSQTCQCVCPSSLPSSTPVPSNTPTPSSIPSPSATPISASPSRSPAPSSVATNYNVLLVGRPDVELAFDMSNGQVDGRVAVNGGLRARSFGVGSRVTPCDSSTAAIVVDGLHSKIDFQQGGLQCGNLVADGSARVIALPGFNNGNNRLVLGNVFNLTGLNFNAEAARAQATADDVCSAGGVAATVSPWREITFQGAVSATEQRFTVEASALNQASSAKFVFAQPSAVEKVVVAVRGGQTSGLTLSNFGINNGGVSGARMTFVVCEASRVTLRGFGLEANLLAVDSQVTLENGQITGKIIAQTLAGSGGIRLP